MKPSSCLASLVLTIVSGLKLSSFVFYKTDSAEDSLFNPKQSDSAKCTAIQMLQTGVYVIVF